MQLLPSQLNELFDLISKSKYFSPTQFSKTASGTEIQMVGTAYYFRIFEDTGYSNSLFVNFSPGEFMYRDASSSISWPQVGMYFNKWLQYLKREMSAPDKWGQLFNEMSHLVGSGSTQKESFSHTEYLDLEAKFQEIKSSLNRIPLLEEQSKALSLQFDNLLELTAKLDKFDWQNLFIGTIISIIIQLKVTPENANLLYELIKNTFKGMFLK